MILWKSWVRLGWKSDKKMAVLLGQPLLVLHFVGQRSALFHSYLGLSPIDPSVEHFNFFQLSLVSILMPMSN